MTHNCREIPLRRPFSRLAHRCVSQPHSPSPSSSAPPLRSRSSPAAAAKTPSCCPATRREEITENLDSVKQLVAEGECVGAENAAHEVGSQVEALGGVDAKLKQALRARRRQAQRSGRDLRRSETETVAPADETPTPKRKKSRRQASKKKAEKEREKEKRSSKRKPRSRKRKKETKPPADYPTPPAETPPSETPPSEEGGAPARRVGVGAGAPVGEGE